LLRPILSPCYYHAVAILSDPISFLDDQPLLVSELLLQLPNNQGFGLIESQFFDRRWFSELNWLRYLAGQVGIEVVGVGAVVSALKRGGLKIEMEVFLAIFAGMSPASWRPMHAII